MDIRGIALKALPAVALVAGLAASPAQASYICTGVSGPANPADPYYDGDMTDSRCDISEVEGALGITIDENLIVGSKSNSNEDGFGDLASWTQDEFGLGTLTITTFDNTSGTWELTGNIVPLFFITKYNGGYDVYSYMGPGTSPFSDSWDASSRGTIGATCSELNCNANVSHLSVHGVVPIPAAVWLFGSGLLGLVGVARRRNR